MGHLRLDWSKCSNPKSSEKSRQEIQMKVIVMDRQAPSLWKTHMELLEKALKLVVQVIYVHKILDLQKKGFGWSTINHAFHILTAWMSVMSSRVEHFVPDLQYHRNCAALLIVTWVFYTMRVFYAIERVRRFQIDLY